MIESFVDLTYRGLSLGRRVKLTQVRPSSGYLELAAPMPVGTRVAIATDDGVAFDAVVTWIHEAVTGAERTPGMTVAPQLAGDLAELWWKERVALPDEEPRATRSRTVTVRPRTRSKPSVPPPVPPSVDRAPVIADLDARVAAAAGLPPRPASEPAEQRTAVMNAVDQERLAQLTQAAVPDEARTGVMNALDQERLEQQARSPDEPAIRHTGEHDVVDDGAATLIMPSVDPAALGLDAGLSNPGIATSAVEASAAAGDAAASGDEIPSGESGDPDDYVSISRDDGGDAEHDDGAAAEGRAADGKPAEGGGDKPPPRRGWFRRRNKKR